MDVSQASQLLGASKPTQITPKSPAEEALRSVGISTAPDSKSLITAQERLLTAMEETQKAAGHSPALLRAADLGEAGKNLTGELPPTELRKILADTTGGNWRFEQAADGTIKATGSSSRLSGVDMPSISRETIANRVASKFDSTVGMNVLEGTLEETRNVALRQAGFGEKYVTAAWSPGESGALSRAAHEAVDAGKTAGHLVAEEKILAEAATEAAEKVGAKALGKTLAKAIPLVGAGVVISDVAGATEDTVDSIKKGHLMDAGIDGVRTVSKAAFGVAGQLASPTIAGGIAVAGVGEGVDLALQSLKSEQGASGSAKELLTETFRNAIHHPDAAPDERHANTLKAYPDLQKAIIAYGLIKEELNKDGHLNPQDHKVLGQIEENVSKLIREDKLSEIKLPQINETRSVTQDHTLS